MDFAKPTYQILMSATRVSPEGALLECIGEVALASGDSYEAVLAFSHEPETLETYAPAKEFFERFYQVVFSIHVRFLGNH